MRWVNLATTLAVVPTFLIICCLSIPLQAEPVAVLESIKGRDLVPTVGSDNGEPAVLLPRVPRHMNQYELLRFVQGAMIVPGLSGTAQRALYREFADYVHQHWNELAHLNTFALRLGVFEFTALSFDGPIPQVFFDRFCETMQLWAVHGFFSLFQVAVVDVETGQRIAVGLNMLGDPPGLKRVWRV
ncbi:MAG: hypothetical protein Q9218_001420 [Villophora microphyllina]